MPNQPSPLSLLSNALDQIQSSPLSISQIRMSSSTLNAILALSNPLDLAEFDLDPNNPSIITLRSIPILISDIPFAEFRLESNQGIIALPWSTTR